MDNSQIGEQWDGKVLFLCGSSVKGTILRIKNGYNIEPTDWIVCFTAPRPSYNKPGDGGFSKTKTDMTAAIKLDGYLATVGRDPEYFAKQIREMANRLLDRLDGVTEEAMKKSSNLFEWAVLHSMTFAKAGKDHESRWVFGVSVDDMVYSGLREDYTSVPVKKDPYDKLKFFIKFESTVNVDEKLDSSRPLNNSGFFDFNIGLSVPLAHGIGIFEGDDYKPRHKEIVFLWQEGLMPLMTSGVESKIAEFYKKLRQFRQDNASDDEASQAVEFDDDDYDGEAGGSGSGGGRGSKGNDENVDPKKRRIKDSSTSD